MRAQVTRAVGEGSDNVVKQVGQLLPKGNRQRLIDLGLLYVSKSGAVVVGLLILPFYNHQLGPDLFGLAALILSLQAFSLMLDFGMATMVGRDLAVAETSPTQRYMTWRSAEWVISLIYALLIFPALLAAWLLEGLLGPLEVSGCMIFFWALTLQNIGQNALLARHRFTEAALIQVIGLLARHGLTAITLFWMAPSLTLFISAQSAMAVVQMLVTRRHCVAELQPGTLKSGIVAMQTHGSTLLRTGRALMLFGLAGAAVMQLDKVIVSSLISTRELGSYFLASSFCLMPISVLAAPVAQFFQPRIVRDFSSDDRAEAQRSLRQFVGVIAVCTLIPAGLIWILREPLIALWLQDVSAAEKVALYSGVLLPGVAIGALGYVPYTILTARQDYRFQAQYSAVLTVLTLISALAAAFTGSVIAICVVYGTYHSVSTIGSWWRCIRLDANGVGIAAAGARLAAVTVLLVFGGVGCLAAITSQFNFFG